MKLYYPVLSLCFLFCISCTSSTEQSTDTADESVEATSAKITKDLLSLEEVLDRIELDAALSDEQIAAVTQILDSAGYGNMSREQRRAARLALYSEIKTTVLTTEQGAAWDQNLDKRREERRKLRASGN